MFGLDNYGSDSDSDHEVAKSNGQQPSRTPPQKSILLSSLPPPSGASNGSAVAAAAQPPSSNGMNLPAPKAQSKRRDGPVKIKVEGLKPTKTSDNEDEPRAKKPRLQTNGEKIAGAGSSTLLAMLPAPKKSSTLALPPPKMLGSAASGGNETGVLAEAAGPIGNTETESQDSSGLEFLPAFLRKPRNGPAPSIIKVGVSAPVQLALPPVAPPQTEEVDFFSIASRLAFSRSSTPRATTGLSSAPVVQEYQPPDPTPYDPYPGYYELPSGEWQAYDPGYYKSHWDKWQAAYSTASDVKGKGKDGRGWEGADNDDMTTVDADEEMRKSNMAERERQKGLTAPPTIVKGNAPQLKQQKANSMARSRHQLSTLLAEAYENREAIEEKIAQGRRNRKEAGNKYAESYNAKPALFSVERDTALRLLRTEGSSTNGWVKFDEKANVTFEKKTPAPGDTSPIPLVRGHGVVTGFTPRQFLALITYPELRAKWVGILQEVKILERYSQHEMCCHTAQPALGYVVSARDTYTVQDTIFNEDGTIERIQTSISDDRIPPRPGRVLTMLTLAGWTLKPHETGTEVIYVFKNNPGGWIPQAVNNRIVSQVPGVISRCADVLSKNGYPPYIAELELKSTILVEGFSYDPKPSYTLTFIGKSGDSFDIYYDSTVYPMGPCAEVSGDGKKGINISAVAGGAIHIAVEDAADRKEILVDILNTMPTQPLAITAQAPTKHTAPPGPDFNMVLIGAGNIMFGSDEGPWNHSIRLEHKLGPRLKILALIDPFVARAESILEVKRTSFSGSAYKDTKVYKTTDEYKEATKGSADPHAILVGCPPAYRGGTTKGTDLEVNLIKLFPKTAYFIEKPISTSTIEATRDVTQQLILNGNIVSVGYMLRYLKCVQEMKRIIRDNNLTVMATNARYSCAYEAIAKPAWWNKSIDMGPVIEQGTHFCDLSRYFGGDVDLESISARSVEFFEAPGKLSKIAFDESVIPEEERIPRLTSAVWKYKGGAVGSFTHAVALHGRNYDCELEVWCDGYHMRLVDPYNAPALFVRRPGSKSYLGLRERLGWVLNVSFVLGDLEERHAFEDDPFYSEVSNFIDTIESGPVPNILSSFEDAAKTYE
ncbi:hypothetical protein FRB97_002855 [Tulasnella sp. 331]|nr:hypothetical protein FRB97_002855 [Tulasnella sp. 331]